MITNDLAKARLAATEGNGTRQLGIALLTGLSIAGLWSAVSPSWFTFRSFAAGKPEARAAAEQTLWISLGVSLLGSGAVWLVFKDWIPALVGAATGAVLFGLGWHAVHSEPLETIPPIQNQDLSGRLAVRRLRFYRNN